MNISRENYEEFFIDYLDGNLSDQEVGVLLNFLKSNPDLELELDGLSTVSLAPPNDEFSEKKRLFKPSIPKIEGISHLDYLCIAHLEGDITEGEMIELELYGDNTTRNEYSKLNLTPDKRIVYKGKAKLLRVGLLNLRLTVIKTIGGVAASIGLLIGLFSLLNNFTIEETIQTAQTIESSLEVNSQPFQAESKPEIVNEDESANEIKTLRGTIASKQQSIGELESIKNTNELVEEVVVEKLAVINPIQTQRLNVEVYALATFPIDQYKPRYQGYEVISQEIVADESIKRVIGLFDLAQMGINSLSRATGGNIKLEADKSLEGKINKIHFETELFAFSMPLNRKQK